MNKYTEYKVKIETDFHNKDLVHLANCGGIIIYENHIESEKEVFIDDNNIRYKFRKVTMVSGAIHYLLIDKHEYKET